MKRAEKETAVLELKEKLGRVRSAILTDFRGLTVADISELRNLLRKNAVEYRVVKNNLLRLAAQDTTLKDLSRYLDGPTAMALCYADPLPAAKILAEFAKTKPALQIKAGYVEGRIMDQADILALSELPPRDVLLARVVGVFQAPLLGLVNVLRGHLQRFVVALEQVRQQREKVS